MIIFYYSYRNGDSIKVQDGEITKKFCGSRIPPSYESSGNEITISFAVVLFPGRFSYNPFINKKKVSNHFIKDLTINKSIEVFESKTASCSYCFRIKVNFLNPNQKLTTQNSINSIFSNENTSDTSEAENLDVLLFQTASAASFFAGKCLSTKTISISYFSKHNVSLELYINNFT